MPNDCVNHLTITSSSDDIISTILESHLQMIPTMHIGKVTKKGIRAEYVTPWKPDFMWLQSLLDTYPSCWIKNEWMVEDGKAGVWIGYTKNGGKHITSTEWDDLSLEAEHYIFNT